MTDGDTILLAGLPRSGTTLICALLNEFPNTLALAEPFDLIDYSHGDPERALAEMRTFVETTRKQALSTGEVRTAHIGGVIPDNWYEPVAQSGRLRRALYEKGMVRIDKALTDNFRLVIKDPALFSACGEFLSPHFRVIAMVRHPLTVLAAWQTVEMPAQRGRIYIAERFHPHLTSIMEAEQDRLDQQVLLVEWLFASYARLPAEDIIRYEDLIASPAETLSRLTPHVGQLRRALHSIDPATRYPGVDLAEIAARLVPKAASFEPFYPDFLASLKPWRTA